ncbi:pIIIa [Turkey adenovirus 3]|uniref:IIIa protein n=1 Tax=Turkey adenovirus 3 TaxID=41678 RepID=Q9YUR2_9ADEN|nr:IIIa protein [Turkey adenovirus 3]AP_000481.1 pIIIa [Turkey siadenovirus A]AAX51175.1 pIIIa [Avirulent turkey hemorrhagic enteritis virus]AAC64527.1 IIIa protein [Turkey adenovirus 3]QNN94716.1 pIIIa [Turkey adenovirus 3]QNN94739.1 pIIIa [Turkey adenovirus 3]QNN94761.1 pIIIa [Turkey adenovirus 3]
MSSKDVAEILSGNAPRLSKEFRNMPVANKMIELEKAIVQPKKTDTPTMLSIIVKQLVDTGAIFPEEASAVYSRLLDRLVKFNSIRNHNNLEGLVNDIQQGQKSVVMSNLKANRNMSNVVVLQNFLQQLPKTVSKGQQNYDSFKGLLKQFVIDYNQFIEVYKSGPDTFLQYNFGPAVQKINLNQSFRNLSNLWGAVVRSEDDIPSLSALLEPQTRYLLLLLSPIAIEQYFTRDSFVWYMLKLYKNTVAPPMSTEPLVELGNVIASLGPSYDQLKLQQGLNYLVTNQRQEYKPSVPDLTKEEEALLRYFQTLLRTKVAGTTRQLRQSDLDNVIQNVNPAAFQGNVDFINRLFDFFSKILKINPDFLTRIVYDSQWKLPPAFFLKSVITPQDLLQFPQPKRIPDPNIVQVPVSNVTVPVPAPRTKFKMPQPVSRPSKTAYRSKYQYPSESDTDTDSEIEVFGKPYGPIKPATIDIDNLSAQFKRLKGKGLDISNYMRRKARNVNVRPY